MSEQVNEARIERRLDQLAEIGETSQGGVTRLAYSDEENQAFEYLRDELPSELETRVDSLGNLFATTDPDADQSIFLGSHLDSVFNGGRLDGALGVVTALEAVEVCLETDMSFSCPPTLTVFRGEESARFGQHTVGSRGALGLLTVDDFAATDQNDVPLWQGMQQAGFRPRNLSEPSIDMDRVATFLEVHIEQGRVLEETDTRLGIVTSIRAPVRYRITVTGQYDHSGATPMSMRRDALAAAGELIMTVEEIGHATDADGDVVATVGDVTAVDGAINTVCGEVTFPLDLRSTDTDFRDDIEDRLQEELDAVAEQRGLDLDWELLDRSSPVQLDDQVINFLDAHATELSTSRRMPSGGGHDAMNFQQLGIPTGMVFVPSVDGVSHNPAEETDPAAVTDSAELLVRALTEYPEHD
jgi:hydantoinase/carbamoylase family amidase